MAMRGTFRGVRWIGMVVGLILGPFTWAQSTFPEAPVSDERHTTFALTGATVTVAPGQVLRGATILVRDQRIVAVGEQVAIPEGSVVYSLDGKYIYPAFIELDSKYGMPATPPKKRARQEKPQYTSNRKGAFGWNDALRTDTDPVTFFASEPQVLKGMHHNGFATVLTHHHDGIARGYGLVLHLNKAARNKQVVRPRASAHFSFKKGSSRQEYPKSLMGAIALLRQSFYDVAWYSAQENPEVNLSLEALQEQRNLPLFFEVRDYLEALRADRIADEFGLSFILRGPGDMYQDLRAVQATGAAWVVPLDFPEALEVADPYTALYAPLKDMMAWEQAPANPARLEQAGIPFALTSVGADSPKVFWKNLRKAVRYGLSEDAALRALTITPSGMVGIADEMGTLEAGKYASFFITDQNPFLAKHTLYEVWSAGERFVYKDAFAIDVAGTYNLNLDGALYTLSVKPKKKGWKARVIAPGSSDTASAVLTVNNDLLTLNFSGKTEPFKGQIRLAGKVNFQGGILDGRGQREDGSWFVWSAIRQEKQTSSSENKTRVDPVEVPAALPVPFGPYGWDTLPEAKTYFIEGATVWTSDSLGKFRGDVIVRNGKIEEVGRYLTYKPGMILINGKDKHLTPGIVDEHSHIAISRGVNEGTDASSAEVRIGDVINPTDINIYRQLAGGVTTVQLLHGSANPIGGQSALIKLRWGQPAESMKVSDASGFIKFALGENVKQSNWGDLFKQRFPQTRMGVEQVYYDYFYRARQYQEQWQDRQAEEDRLVQQIPVVKNLFPMRIPIPRRDLELEALAEILDSTRFITCHSYVQSEINMLMHVGDSMGFRVNTFTHILEGYKLADKLRAHGAHASTFADWWAYKYEVNDAIPYNAALLHRAGVVTAINSDDAEMGRRLNQEAAKAVKYGGVSEAEALKMVTLHPAQMLHLDHRIGSILPGKDADLVLWSGPPLSMYSQVEWTMIDGAMYYSQEMDAQYREQIRAERARLIAKMMKAKAEGEKTRKVKPHHQHLYHCDDEKIEIQ